MKNKKYAIIRNGRIIYGETSEITQGNELQAQQNREAMKTKYRKDLLQRNQTDYYKAYPEQLENLSDPLKRLLS